MLEGLICALYELVVCSGYESVDALSFDFSFHFET